MVCGDSPGDKCLGRRFLHKCSAICLLSGKVGTLRSSESPHCFGCNELARPMDHFKKEAGQSREGERGEREGTCLAVTYHSREHEKPGAAAEEGRARGASEEVGTPPECSRETSQDESLGGAEVLGRSSAS